MKKNKKIAAVKAHKVMSMIFSVLFGLLTILAFIKQGASGESFWGSFSASIFFIIVLVIMRKLEINMSRIAAEKVSKYSKENNTSHDKLTDQQLKNRGWGIHSKPHPPFDE